MFFSMDVQPLSQWWIRAFDEQIARKTELAKLLRITIYGPWKPDEQKKILLDLVHSLNGKGFMDTDVVEGALRPNPKNLNSFDISASYLESSDVNFLVFTLEGACRGVDTELGYVLMHPIMVNKRSNCVVFNQERGGRQSLSQLQIDRLKDLGDIPLVPFNTWEQLNESAYYWATEYLKRYEPILIGRLSR